MSRLLRVPARVHVRSGSRAASRVAVVFVVSIAWAAATAGTAGAYLYWGNFSGGAVGRANTDGSAPSPSFIPGASAPAGVAVDSAYVYWAGSNKIGRARLDGTGTPNASFIVTANLSDGVAVDGAHIYWADGGDTAVGRANIDGSGVVDPFIQVTDTVNGVAVDGDHVYWANFGGSIGRANLDGTGVQQAFITVSNGNPLGVTSYGPYIYWAAGASIGRSNLDGTGIVPTFINTGGGARALAVDGTYIYWSKDGGTVGRAKLDGTGVTPNLIPAATSASGIAVDGLPSGSVSANPTTLAFGSQPLDTFGAPLPVTITNNKFGHLLIEPPSLTGQADDFLISSDHCSGSTLQLGASCTLGLRFGPSAGGARTATLNIGSDDPASPVTVGLTGTGGTLPQGPIGPTGPAGQPGPAGKVELVSCTTVTKTVVRKAHGKRKKVKLKSLKCTGKLVSGTVKFTATGKITKAKLVRGGVAYANGTATRSGSGLQLLLLTTQRLPAGRYVVQLSVGLRTTSTTLTIR